MVKEQHFKEAQRLFADVDIEVSSTCCCFLGGYVGRGFDVREHVRQRAETWVKQVERLANAARA